MRLNTNNSVTAGIRKNSHMFQISHNRMRERISGSGNLPVLFGLLVCVLFNSYALFALRSTCGNCCLRTIFENTRILYRFWLHSTTKPGVYLACAIQRPVHPLFLVAMHYSLFWPLHLPGERGSASPATRTYLYSRGWSQTNPQTNGCQPSWDQD